MPSVTANNVKINYIEQGAGNEALVFVHGYSGGLRDWHEALQRLPKEYHAYALDLRGHGQSDRPGSYQLAEFVEDIYAFSRELGIGQFTYVGHSLGGKIGYQFALDHPDVLKAMVLAAPAPAHDFVPPDQRAAVIPMVTAAFGSTEGMKGFFGQTNNPPSQEVLNELINDALAADPAAKEECAVWWISTNLEPQLGDIRVPTLIVAGAKDDLPVDWERRYAHAIDGCRFEVREDDGHFLPQESPQEFVDLLTSFIKGVSAG
jgi:pimeloyl-ACP methyl ester carboxylesterase